MSSTTRIAPTRSRARDAPPGWLASIGFACLVYLCVALLVVALVVAPLVGPIVRRWRNSGLGEFLADGGDEP